MIIIDRCEKKPGVIVGARMYKLILNEDGLYVLQLGKAMGPRNQSNPIADRILDNLQAKREKAHAEKEREMMSGNLKDLIDNKKNFLITKADMQELKPGNMQYSPKLKIKSGGLKITLHFHPQDREKVEGILAYFKK